jgi:site-specific DNA-methyltransferase (adenine-specific)
MLKINSVYKGTSLELLKQLDNNSIDSIITDPPYELGFMGKSWDNTGIAYNLELWQECLRVLKHGGHLLAFGGTRTYHRMACAIEDAGFEIRDQLQWIYGSGFPKSQDIGKMYNKKYTNNELSVKLSGWGTSLKPANEPILMARKPLSEKTVVENVLKWGTGGINIDDCKIGDDVIKSSGEVSKAWREKEGRKDRQTPNPTMNIGRFPANVILDEEAGNLLDEQSGILKSGAIKKGQPAGTDWKSGDVSHERIGGRREQPKDIPASEGGASRFFYCAKASKKEKGEFNDHPTVKPVKLMEYLVRLITPENGICLDPFAGSGTTLLACINMNKNYIGFELNQEYVDIINKRIHNIV